MPRMLWRIMALLMVLVTVPVTVQARPFTVDDLLKAETLGKLAVDPTGRWLVFERREAFTKMERFDDLAHADILRSRLFRVDLHARAGATPLGGSGTTPGSIILGFSPDGQHLAIARWQGALFKLGIASMQHGGVRWHAISPSYNPFLQTWGWVSPTQLVIIAEEGTAIPTWLDHQAWSRLQTERWSATAQGRLAVTLATSGPRLGAPQPRSRQRLLLLDIGSDRTRELASGHFSSFVVAPDGHAVAVVENDAMRQPHASSTVNESDWPFIQNILLVGLDDGATWRPCRACSLAGAPRWAPSGRAIAYWAAPPDGHTMLVRADMHAQHAQFIAANGLGPAAPDDAPACDIAWQGTQLNVLVHRNAPLPQWYRLGPDARFLAFEQDQVPKLAKTCPVAITPPLGDMGLRALPWQRSGARIRFSRSNAGAQSITLAPGERIARAGAAAAGSTLLIEIIGATGETVLQRVVEGRRETLATLNASYADITPATALPLRHAIAGHGMLTSWLYLPGNRPFKARLPLVVIPYPGLVFSETPPADQQLGSERLHTSAQLLASAGFAVLLPSMPMPDILPDAGFSFAGVIDPAVDAAIATGFVHAERIGLWGHGYGAYAAAMTVSETKRYRAAVLSSGIYDLDAIVGIFGPAAHVRPAEGLQVASRYAWAERGQGRMGAPPWAAPGRYIANSPIFRAGRISAPLLIIAQDHDVSPVGQAEQLFSTMFRQGKDAQLVTYWGEGHVVGSPANLNDLYRRIVAFFSTRPAQSQAAEAAKLPEPASPR